MEITDRAMAGFIGAELRRRREARGWTREQMVQGLPSGIGDRTLLSYEHGIRFLTVVRFIELCRALEAAPHEVLQAAMARAADLANVSMLVHLPALLRDEDPRFEAVRLWAKRRMSDATEALLVAPATVREMAAVLGVEHAELAAYLAEFARGE